jgi:hypothetical protein
MQDLVHFLQLDFPDKADYFAEQYTSAMQRIKVAALTALDNLHKLGYVHGFIHERHMLFDAGEVSGKHLVAFMIPDTVSELPLSPPAAPSPTQAAAKNMSTEQIKWGYLPL